MTQGKLYHYVESGLDWVYLKSGYTIRQTPYGSGLSIQNADGLYAVIVHEIVTRPFPIRGQELRFLRSFLDMSQDNLGKIVGVGRVQIARYEGKRTEAITASVDHALRYFFGMRAVNKDVTDRILEVLQEMDRAKHGPETLRETFQETRSGWKRAA